MRRHLSRLGSPHVAWLALLAALVACAPIARPAPFVGAPQRVTGASLWGPFDGVVVDETTDEPVADAVVVGAWSFDRGDGLHGPAGSQEVVVRTDAAGRYRIPRPKMAVRGATIRLTGFSVVVYKRGYLGYRSDILPDGRPRGDFYIRQNRVVLRKWRDTDSHAEHLLYLAAPGSVAGQTAWERSLANEDLYRQQTGQALGRATGPAGEGPDLKRPEREVLDARGLLTADDVRLRTGFTETFQVKELGDFPREAYYHGIHLQAEGRQEVWDVAFRVWSNPPGGLDPVQETLAATLPGVPRSGEVTDETWVLNTDDVRAVGFLDRDRNVGVLLTCGSMQCVDADSAIILAKAIHSNLDNLTVERVPVTPDPDPPAPETGPQTAEPSPEPGGSADDDGPEPSTPRGTSP